MAVVIILGVVAAAAIPNFSSTDQTKLDNAANEIKGAIQFTQAESIRTSVPHGIILDTATERLRVYRLPAATPVYDVYHPIDKKLYDLQLNTAAFLSGVDITSANFSFNGSSGTTAFLHFSTEGYPEYINAGTVYLLTSATIILSYDNQKRTITIAPMTGRVTVQ